MLLLEHTLLYQQHPHILPSFLFQRKNYFGIATSFFISPMETKIILLFFPSLTHIPLSNKNRTALLPFCMKLSNIQSFQGRIASRSWDVSACFCPRSSLSLSVTHTAGSSHSNLRQIGVTWGGIPRGLVRWTENSAWITGSTPEHISLLSSVFPNIMRALCRPFQKCKFSSCFHYKVWDSEFEIHLLHVFICLISKTILAGQ